MCTGSSDGSRQGLYLVIKCEGSDTREEEPTWWPGGGKSGEGPSGPQEDKHSLEGEAFCLGTTEARGARAQPRGQMRLT